MNFKKRVNGSWVDTPYYINNTSTDTITTFPTDIYANDNNATVGLKGNTVQNDTPSPSNPVNISGVGDMSKNLFTGDYAQFDNVGGTGNTYAYFKIDDDFALTVIAKNNVTVSDEVYFGISTVGGTASGGTSWVVERNKRYTQGDIRTVTSVTDDRHYVSLYRKNADTLKFITDNFYVMLNYGSEPLPYEPYNPYYKIPILCGNQTTNIYLGETQSTRTIKKLVLTGEENWEQQSGQTADYFGISNMAALPSKVFCTHFLSPDTDINYASTVTGIKMQQSSSYGVILACRPPNVTGLANFKSFLATQYANGTPVTVWYVLATPETATINEPLMKIGDYADTLSGVSISTIKGANVVDIFATLKPSDVQLEYKGWHPVQSVHEYDSNYTIATMQSLTVAQLQEHTISELQGGEWS